MAAKVDGDVVIRALKERWFKLAATEDYLHTPKITKELDHIERAIAVLKKSKPEPAAHI